MSDALTIAGLRAEMKLSLGDFAELLGMSSKGHLSQIERDNRCSLPVALRIEELSGGRVDAADLSDDVRAARAGLSHGPANIATETFSSAGNISGDSPSDRGMAA